MLRLLIFLVLASSAYSFEDNIELRLLGESSANSAYQARKEITDQLVLEASKKLVIELVGEAEYTKKKSAIDRLIKAQYGKFIPFMSPEDLPRKNSKFQMAIDFQISRNSLREILAKEGLLFEKTANVVVLPFVGFLDSYEAQSLKWWYSNTKASPSLKLASEDFENQLNETLWTEGFFLLKPQTFGLDTFLSKDLRVDSHRKKDMANMAQEKDANLVIYGSLRFAPDEILTQNKVVRVNLRAMLAKNQKIVAEVEKKWSHVNIENGSDRTKLLEYYKEAVDDLVLQVKEAWQKGKFSTNSLNLVLKADLTYPEFEGMKNLIKSASYQIKNLKERKMSKGSYELELDISGAANELVQQLKELRSEKWQFSVGSLDEGELELQIKRK